MSFFEQIKKEREPTKKLYGFQWVTMLIKYDLDGNAEVVRCFNKPAKDSSIKSASTYKTTKKNNKPEKVNMNTDNVEVEELW